MNTTSKTLGQAEIDAMLAAQVADPNPGLLPTVKPISASQAIRGATGDLGAAPGGDLSGGSVARMAARLDALEAATKGLPQTEHLAADASAEIKQLRQGLQIMAKHLQTLTARIDEMAVNLEATPGYGLRKKFVCSSCKNKGFVAAPARCTCCGREIMVGWSPQKRG